VVTAAEALGFEAVMLPEHLLTPAWPQADLSTKYWYDLPTLGAFIAAATTRLKLLTSVLIVPYHPPVAMAKALATLDVLAGGRLLCGVGTGWMRAEFRRLGIPFEQRGAITDEYLRAMIELWTSASPRFSGRYVSFDDVSAYPKPVQQPHIPLLIGGTGPRPWRRVAALGDGWLPMVATPDEIAQGIAAITMEQLRPGRELRPLWVGYTGVTAGYDPLVQQMRGHVVDEANVVPRGAVGPDALIREIERYRAAGVTFLSIGFAWKTAADLIRELEWFARETMPAFNV